LGRPFSKKVDIGKHWLCRIRNELFQVGVRTDFDDFCELFAFKIEILIPFD
jgi:hypothetical protein